MLNTWAFSTLQYDLVQEVVAQTEEIAEMPKSIDVAARKKINVWDKMKHTIIELFKEEDDKII